MFQTTNQILVGGFNPSENMKVNWDDCSNIWKKMFQTTISTGAMTPPMPRAARAYPATTGVTSSSCKPPFRAWQVEKIHETPLENDGE